MNPYRSLRIIDRIPVARFGYDKSSSALAMEVISDARFDRSRPVRQNEPIPRLHDLPAKGKDRRQECCQNHRFHDFQEYTVLEDS